MKTKITLRRTVLIIMCLLFLSCAVGGLINAATTGARTGNSVGALASQETKARLLRQITEEGWDPYSADMTVEEFYALMELIDEGMLPSDTTNTAAISAYSALGVSASDAGAPKAAADSGIFIPRAMFLLNGLENYDGDNPPAEDPDGTGYKLPPGDWDGVGVTTDQDTGALRAAVLVKGINDDKPNVAGDVNQDLFPKYDGYYVRRVTAEGVEVSILGVIDKGDGNYVYYYMSSEDQSTLVSSTTLPDGAKFIVNYSINEHEITYEIEMSDGSNVPANITLDSVFGATRPTKTVDAAYSFDIIAPYGYTARVFRETNGNRVELTGTELSEENRVNNGYPLGAEPVYTIQNGKQVPDTDSGPSVMTRNATFYNDLVKEDRTVVAVLTKRDAPVFNAFNLLPNIDNTKGRGTSAFYKVKAKDRETGEEIEVLYDYEDVFEWANGRESKYDYVESSITSGGANKGNVQGGNVATADNWGWNKNVDVTNDAKMDYDEGTDSYSYQWTFQTNSSSGGYTLDTLEINGVAIRIPYLPKQTNGNNETTGANGGIRTWFTEGTLPDGAAVRVEFLMSFNNNPQQRVYRIVVTGAHSNVTLTNMNLMQGTGAPEMSVYNLVGVHADTGNTTSQLPMIEYYTAAFENIPANQWYKGNLADVLVRQPNYGGDENHHGANIRFKLADGYGEPFYLYESYLGNVINGQASAERMADGVTFDNAQKVQPLPEDNSVKLESQYIYGPDDEGWYYIRLTTQEDNINKFALLTIIAKPVRYVVRYVPSGDFPADPDENLEARSPANMPTFDHTNSDPSFQESPNGWQYDDNNGFYYDTVTNNKISITTTVPNDPKNWYKFVDWVIVDAEGNPVQVPPESQTVSLYSGELKGQVGEAAQDNSIHITSNRALDVNDVNEYSIENDGLGGNAVSVRVIRLMPTWEKIQNPYKYSVVVDWVDSLGELHQEHFDEYWDDILTDSTDKNLTVFVNKDAEPLQRWLAEHPTYLFWDEVNNAVDNKDGKAIDKIEVSMNALYPELRARNDWDQPGSLYNKVLTELLKMDISGGLKGDQPDNIDDFSRLGGYAFSVHQNGGKIVIWMCEKKSGLDIRNDVQVDALSEGEEFYYTVNATSGNLPLEGIYKAYPEGFEVTLEDGTKERRIKDEDGTERKMLDSDAWLVKFENGKISNIIKNVEGAEFPENPENPVTYFTFEGSPGERVNKGIILYAPLGDYTVTEVGSKSGGSYKVNLYYINDAEAHVEGTVEWRKASGDQWLRCSEKRPITEINDPDYDKILDGTYSQVSAGIKYKIGSCNKLYIMQFINQTSSLTIGNEVKGSGNSTETTFDYTVKLNLPENVKPLWEGDNENSAGYYYFNYKRGHADNHEDPNSTLSFVEPGKIILTKREGASDGFNWEGTVKISSGERVVIVTSVPEQNIPQTMAQEATKPANYSIYEDRGEAEEKYPLKEIITSDSSIATSVDGSTAAGMLGAAKSHSITFWHVPTLPETGGKGVGLICISGILLMAAGLWLLSSKKTVI